MVLSLQSASVGDKDDLETWTVRPIASRGSAAAAAEDDEVAEHAYVHERGDCSASKKCHCEGLDV